jgi:hypothetical protein
VWPDGVAPPAAGAAPDEGVAPGLDDEAPDGDRSPADLGTTGEDGELTSNDGEAPLGLVAAGEDELASDDDGAPLGRGAAGEDEDELASDDGGAPRGRDAAVADGRAPAFDHGGDATEGGGASNGASTLDGRDGAAPGSGFGSGDVAPEHVAAALARTLGRWSRTGHAARFVQAWAEELALAWIGAIAIAAGRDSRHDDATAAMTAEAVERIAGAVLGEDDGAADRTQQPPAAQRLLVLLAALTSALGDRLPDEATRALARRRITVRDETEPVGAVVRPVGDGPGYAPPRTALPGDGAPRRGRAVGHVVPVLPFLVLAQLSRIGYVDAIVATATTAGLPPGAVGAAVAGKSLPAPHGDGDRDPVDLAAMVLAAGSSEAELPEVLELIADCEPRLLAPLASALQGAYAEGRSANDELLVWRGIEGIVCGEEEGLLPAAWVATDAELDAVLASLGRPPVRRDDDELGAVARALQDRRTLPGAPALEQHFGAAAGTALGMIALNLWRSSARATPLLALERLADLEALVRSETGGLLVSIPRGQRWLDLQRAGMLELFAIPWLPGDLLEIGTW